MGFDQNDGMDTASFEKFKEKMKRAAAQIKAIKKEEKKRKKKEDELVKILLKFIQTSEKKDLVLVISRALERNIPANFILAIVLLGNEDIQKAVGNFLMLEAPEAPEKSDGESTTTADTALVFFKEDESLPLRVRIEIDQWIKGLIYQASEHPQKLLSTAYNVEETEEGHKKEVGHQLVQLTAHVIFDFLKQNNIEEEMPKLREFSEFLLKGVLSKTKEDLDSRPELEG